MENIIKLYGIPKYSEEEIIKNNIDCWKCRDGSIFPYDKKDIIKVIDIHNFQTVIPFLKEMNYPAIETEWKDSVDWCKQLNQESVIVFQKYIAKMHLRAYKDLVYGD